jgi:hypothetical protein
MNETIKAHVDQVLDDILGICLQAAERIEALRPGEKLPATSLAEDLAREPRSDRARNSIRSSSAYSTDTPARR